MLDQQTAGSRQQAAGTFGSRLKQLRGEKPLEQMAVEIGISATLLFGYEEEFIEIVAWEFRDRFEIFCSANNISYRWLLLGDEAAEAA